MEWKQKVGEIRVLFFGLEPTTMRLKHDTDTIEMYLYAQNKIPTYRVVQMVQYVQTEQAYLHTQTRAKHYLSVNAEDIHVSTDFYRPQTKFGAR